MKKPVLLSLTVISLLTLSSCGKSNDSKKASDVPSQPQSQSQPNPAPEQNGAPVPAVDDVGLNGPTNSPLPAAPTVRPGSAPTTPGGNSADETDANSSSVLRPPLAAPIKEITAADLKFDESEAVKTGGKLQTLNYTSAGRDGLMTEFKLKSKSVSAEQQAMNQKLAAAVVTAKLSRVAATGEVFVNITSNEFEKIQTYKIKAVTDGDKMKLVSATATGDLEFQGGFLKCTDLDGGCENAYAKIKMSGAYTRIIFRNSYANHNFGIYTNEASAKNLNFELWKSYILNKTSNVATSEKIDYVQVASFEVLNGKSGMGMLLMTADQDMLGLSIPLLAADKGSLVSAPVSKLSDISKNYDLGILANQYSQKLSQALKDVKLIANNGLGQLRMVLSFSADAQDSKIFMTLSKVQKPVMSVLDVQKFEAKIPKF